MAIEKKRPSEILEVMLGYSSDDLRSVQTSLSKTCNQIRDLLNGRARDLYSDGEKESLRAALSILIDSKDAFEAAKERRAHEEKKREREREINRANARKALKELLPEDNHSLAYRMQLVALVLVCYQQKKLSYDNYGYYYDSIGYGCHHYDIFRQRLEARVVELAKQSDGLFTIFSELREVLVRAFVYQLSEDKPGFAEGIRASFDYLDTPAGKEALEKERLLLAFIRQEIEAGMNAEKPDDALEPGKTLIGHTKK